jgi:DNA-binding MarR family transcriptional regulator
LAEGGMASDLRKQFQNEDFLLYCLPGVARRASAICAHEYYAEFGMKVPEWRLLAQVGRFGSISAKALSDKITMDQVAISRAVYQCVKRGLIREIVNPRDRRSKVLALTPTGRAFLKRFFPRACALAARMEEGLTESEAQMLKRLLNKLDRHLLTLPHSSSQKTDAK